MCLSILHSFIPRIVPGYKWICWMPWRRNNAVCDARRWVITSFSAIFEECFFKCFWLWLKKSRVCWWQSCYQAVIFNDVSQFIFPILSSISSYLRQCYYTPSFPLWYRPLSQTSCLQMMMKALSCNCGAAMWHLIALFPHFWAERRPVNRSNYSLHIKNLQTNPAPFCILIDPTNIRGK